jgi:hypothetical protein
MFFFVKQLTEVGGDDDHHHDDHDETCDHSSSSSLTIGSLVSPAVADGIMRDFTLARLDRQFIARPIILTQNN